MLRSVIRTPLNSVLRGPLDVLGSGGGGGVADSDAQAIIDAMTATPSAARQTSIETLVTELKTGPTHGTNVWSDLEALWVTAAADSQAALLNWKDPTGTAATEVSSPTFTADLGYVGNGSGYLNTSWNVVDDAVSASVHDFALGVAIGAVGASNDVYIGGYSSGANDRAALSTNTTAVVMQGPHRSFSVTAGAISADSLLAIEVSASNRRRAYVNGVNTYTRTTEEPGTALATDLFIMASNQFGTAVDNQASGEVRVAFTSTALTANQHADLNAAINNYLTGL